VAIPNYLKVEIRRHLKYPLVGSPISSNGNQAYSGTMGQAGGLIGFRYFEYMPLLEYRMNNISQEEEVALLGSQSSYFSTFWVAGSSRVTVTAASPVVGDQPTVQVNGQALTYTVNVADTAALVATGIANSINANSSVALVVIAQASANVVTITSRTLGALANTLTIVGFGSPSVALAVTNASAVAAVTLQGGQDPPGPVWLDTAQTVSQPYFGYVPIIRYWESQLTNAASGMDTIKADVFTQRQDELAARSGGYQFWCKRLAQFFAIPYGGAGTYDQTGSRKRVS
jgi:hypothetical protein